MFTLHLFPAFKEFANTAPCLRLLGIDGAYLVFIPVFCIPLVSALLLVALWGREYTAILRLAQYPLPGQKSLNLRLMCTALKPSCASMYF